MRCKKILSRKLCCKRSTCAWYKWRRQVTTKCRGKLEYSTDLLASSQKRNLFKLTRVIVKWDAKCLGMGMVLRGNNVLLRCKCMHVLEYMIALSCLVIRFRPTSRIVSRLYRERTMEKLRTNADARSNELKHVLARKTRPNRFWTWLAFQLVLFLLYTRQTCQTGFHFAATTLQRKKKKKKERKKENKF